MPTSDSTNLDNDTVVLASGNKKKLKELSEILSRFEKTLVPQAHFQVEDAIEDGLTFVENAIIKARHACNKTGLPSIADDSGIEVDYLKGKPGIYSARFAGEKASDQQNLDKLLTELNGVPASLRTARYQCVIVFMRHAKDPTPLVCQASWEGSLLTQAKGDGGFGYDPIFWLEENNCTSAELSPQQKHAISHRGKAVRQFLKQFQQEYLPS